MAIVAECFLGANLSDDPGDYFDASGRSRFYGAIHASHGGISILSDFTQKSKSHCLVNVPGKALEQLPGGGLPAVASFLGRLEELGPVGSLGDDEGSPEGDGDAPVVGRVFKVTRLDLAFDGVPFGVQQCIDAASDPEARNVRSPTRKGTAHISLGKRDVGEDGDTFEWGQRTSKSRMVRVYDRREAETGVRFEMEWRGDRSDLLARELAGLAPQAWATRSIAHLRDFIDFIDSSSSSNVSRCDLLPWWAGFVQGINRIRMKIVRPVRPLVEKVANMIARHRKGVATLERAFGRYYVDHHLVRMGEFAFTATDRRDIKELRRLGEEDPEAVKLWPSLRQVVGQVVGAILPLRRPSFEW
jgi:hypothetical protein